MIVHSDNYATILLESHLDRNVLEKIYTDFSLPKPPLLNWYDPFIDSRQYASFFRILYNSTYIQHDLSNFALELLTQTTFHKGIRQGVPQATIVASKFGIYTNDNVTQLHECGIIYAPERPFLLCVMTKGNDIEAQETFIADVTRTIYQKTNR